MCPTSPSGGLIEALFAVVDCHIRTVVYETYLRLVGPETVFAQVLTALLTLYIALIGYQLMLGRGGLRITQMPIEALKIGLILAFTTSWSAYQVVIYDVVWEGPRYLADLVASAAGGSATRGDDATNDVYAGLQSAYVRLSYAASVFGAAPGAAFGVNVLWAVTFVMLFATVGVLLAAKVVLGVLLALGPVFVAMLLFTATRGLFVGWLRMLLTFAASPVLVIAVTTGFLGVMEPFLARLTDQARGGQFDMSTIVAIGLMTSVFALVITQVLRAAAGITEGLRPFEGAFAPAPSGVGTYAGGFAGAGPGAVAATSSKDAPTPGLAVATLMAATAEDRRTIVVRETSPGARLAADRLDHAYRRLPRPAKRTGGET